jgi:hypothetical protein
MSKVKKWKVFILTKAHKKYSNLSGLSSFLPTIKVWFLRTEGVLERGRHLGSGNAGTRGEKAEMYTKVGTRGKKAGTRGEASTGPEWAAFAHTYAVATGESASGFARLSDHSLPA